MSLTKKATRNGAHRALWNPSATKELAPHRMDFIQQDQAHVLEPRDHHSDSKSALDSMMRPASRAQFSSLWRYFLSRSHTRDWLCDATVISIAHAVTHTRKPPLLLAAGGGGATASRTLHTLFVLGHDAQVALGILVDGCAGELSSTNADVRVHRTALAHIPDSNVLLLAAFAWLRSGSLVARFGVLANTGDDESASSHSAAPTVTPDMTCRWNCARVYDPAAAQTIANAVRIGTSDILADSIAAPQDAHRDLDEDKNSPNQSPLTQGAVQGSLYQSSACRNGSARPLRNFSDRTIPVESSQAFGTAYRAESDLWKGSARTLDNPLSQIDAAFSFPTRSSAAATVPTRPPASTAVQVDPADAAPQITTCEEVMAPAVLFSDRAVGTEPYGPGADPLKHMGTPTAKPRLENSTPPSVKSFPFLDAALNLSLKGKHGTELSSSPVSASGQAGTLRFPGDKLGLAERGSSGVVKKQRPTAQTLECPQCGAHIRGKRGNLNRHIAARHERVRGFACAMPGCGLAFQSKLNLVRHMTRVHEGRPHQCRQCPRGFRSAGTLAKHARAAHAPRSAFACRACAVCFGRRSVLDNHVARVHGDKLGVANAPVPTATFTCSAPKCGHRFSDWGEMKTHEREMHAGRVHQCPGCEGVFETEAALSKHIRTDHGQTKTSRNCPVCGCVYSQRSNLLRHISLAHRDFLRRDEFCDL